jgi:hypothetical protein
VSPVYSMQDLWFSRTLFTVLCETKGHSVHFVYILYSMAIIFIMCSVYRGVYYTKRHIQYLGGNELNSL